MLLSVHDLSCCHGIQRRQIFIFSTRYIEAAEYMFTESRREINEKFCLNDSCQGQLKDGKESGAKTRHQEEHLETNEVNGL